MSRITEDIVQRIDIVDVVSRYVTLKRTGTNFSGNCPFHQEKTPSFVVSSNKQIFKCFGCGKGGNVITFLMEIERLDFWDAIKELAKDAHIDLKEYEVNMEKLQEIGEGKEKIKRMHQLAQNFFLSGLQENTTAQAYIHEKRKLDTQTIEQFGIGYAPENHYSLVQYLKSKGFSDADIVEASLGKKGNTGEIYSFFRNRIMFPIYDTMKSIVAFGARAMSPEDMPKYLNSANHSAYDKSKILYGIDQLKTHIKDHNFAIIVEGYMDVIGIARLGYPIGVATCGTSLTNEHMKLLKRYTEKVYMVFDNDKAGLQATIKGLHISYEQDIFPLHIQLPDSIKDLDELANHTDGKQLFTSALENAQDGFVYVLDALRRDQDIASPVHKQTILNTMFGCIMSIHNTAIQAHYLQVLADNIGIAYEVLLPQYKHYAKTEGKTKLQHAIEKTTKSMIHQPTKEDVFFSLLYEKRLYTITHTMDIRSPILHFIETCNTYTQTLGISSPINNTSDESIKQRLQEAHIRRERELERYTDEQDKRSAVCKAITPFIQDLLPHILKNNQIPHEVKQELLTLRKQLRG